MRKEILKNNFEKRKYFYESRHDSPPPSYIYHICNRKHYIFLYSHILREYLFIWCITRCIFVRFKTLIEIKLCLSV